MRDVLVNTSMCKYSAVRKAADKLGWTECEEGRENWQMFWTDLSVNHARVKALQPLQRINHFADMTCICNKAQSALVLRSLLKYFQSEYHFFPQSWSLPKETSQVVSHLQPAEGNPRNALILKPSRGCQGADIALVTSVEQLDAARTAMGGTTSLVAQEYVDRPLLLGGYKFDLRLYVLVTSCVPLRVHLFRDGIGRLCAEKYHPAKSSGKDSARGGGGGFDGLGGDWRYRHLTNYAINKHHPEFSVGEDGAKRRLGSVLDQLASQGHDVDLLWGEIQQLAVKTLIAVQPTLAHAYMSCRPGPDVHPFSCFELLGLDLLGASRPAPQRLYPPALSCPARCYAACPSTLRSSLLLRDS